MNVGLSEQEQVLRRVNEALERGFLPADESTYVRIRCECGRPECNAFIRMRVADYETVRSDPRPFVVLSGHQTPAIEAVVEERPDHLVVRKTGAAGRAAAASDPRRAPAGEDAG